MTSRSEHKDESREEMLDWLRKEFGKDTARMAERFIDRPHEHPYEIAARIHREIRGTKNQHGFARPNREVI
ncbi:MAG: hypothetical protein DMF62_04665 [Acidobacteria bacterium]|nr:MAG: hypothetical protein DMF62_04665 [Acidobacteriota bacterium]